MTKEKSRIREILEKHAGTRHLNYPMGYEGEYIIDMDFDKLEEELQEYMGNIECVKHHYSQPVGNGDYKCRDCDSIININGKKIEKH